MLRIVEHVYMLTGRDEKFPVLFADVEILVPGAEPRGHFCLCYFGLHGCNVRLVFTVYGCVRAGSSCDRQLFLTRLARQIVLSALR